MFELNWAIASTGLVSWKLSLKRLSLCPLMRHWKETPRKMKVLNLPTVCRCCCLYSCYPVPFPNAGPMPMMQSEFRCQPYLEEC